ncbi:MAG: hypothetical protein LUE14_01505 [Clostridiales bacterium]|nr:hypothetical protein [Clostridiales bacterium]
MKDTRKTEWVIRVHGWSGKPYTTVDADGIRTYHPGTEFGWKDFKTGFKTAAEADAWLMDFLRTEGGLITDYTIRKREATA